MVQPAVRKANLAALDDAELVRRALGRDADAFATIMQRHNQRLYRIARSVLRNSTEAEDAVQEAYVAAFTHLATYRGESPFAGWLARIVMNEALGRLRRKPGASDFASLEAVPEAQIIPFPSSAANEDPERTMAQRQILQLVENATDALPEVYRVVFVTRVVEGMSVEETAELLRIRPETVKTRLHRARQLLRDQLNKQIGPVMMDAFRSPGFAASGGSPPACSADSHWTNSPEFSARSIHLTHVRLKAAGPKAVTTRPAKGDNA